MKRHDQVEVAHILCLKIDGVALTALIIVPRDVGILNDVLAL